MAAGGDVVGWGGRTLRCGHSPRRRAIRKHRRIRNRALDLGCGGGLMLAVLASARKVSPAAAASTRRLVGVETRPTAAAIARRSLGDEAEIVTDDARRRPLPPARATLLFDVLNLMPAGDQDALLAAVRESLEPGGVLLLREADAAAGWRFRAVRAGDWIKACWVGRFAQNFHFRPRTEWCRWLEQAGFDVEVRPMGMGTPFGNVLLVGPQTRLSRDAVVDEASCFVRGRGRPRSRGKSRRSLRTSASRSDTPARSHEGRP